mgnify:CR=1 FL=1
MNIAVQGCGAMGSIYAALLCSAGHSVWVMSHNTEHMAAIARTGLRVSGASGDRIVTPTVVNELPDIPIDLLILAVKAGAVADAAASCKGSMACISRVVTIQNGLGSADTVADLLGTEKLVVGVAQGFGASIVTPGHVHHNDMKAIRLGTYGDLPLASVEELASSWRQVGFDAEAVHDILSAQWEKLICNVAYSAPCALTGLTVGEAMQDDALGPITRDAALEAYDVAQALNIPLSFDDPVAYIRAFAERMPDAKPSVLLDIESGKPSEVGVINGSIPQQASKVGLSAPVNATLTRLVKAMENRFSTN